MAEGSSPTNKIYAKFANLLAAVNAWIALDKGDMAAFDASTNALASEATESGVARAAATVTQETTTVTGDSVQWYKSFAVNATVALTGAGVFSASGSGDMWAWHRWPATVNAIAGDTINETIKDKQEIGA
jgi:hypothetical protein